LPPNKRSEYTRRDVLDVSGSITIDTVWNAELVRVVGDVTVEDGVSLTLEPGIRVEFQDFYVLTILGTLAAVGTPTDRIVFTTDDPQDFSIDQSHTGCWNGIRFDNTSATNAPSRLVYCIIEYSKATQDGNGLYPYGGGAVSVVGFSKLSIENCIIRHNVADYGGAIFLYRNANPSIVGNLIVDNHALQNAGAVYCAYAYPTVGNNTILRNTIHNEENPYIDSCAGLNFIAKPVFANNIIRDNDSMVTYLHSQLLNNKDFYTHHNNIEDYPAIGGNIDADPLFVDPDGPDDTPGTSDDNFRLRVGSPCIDAGLNDGAPSEVTTDLDGAVRLIDGDGDGVTTVDMGPLETGDCDGDGLVDADAIANGQVPDCNRNVIPDECDIAQGTSSDEDGDDVPDECQAPLPIPALSGWGLVAMALLVVSAGSLIYVPARTHHDTAPSPRRGARNQADRSR
jgi:hypothetical protein